MNLMVGSGDVMDARATDHRARAARRSDCGGWPKARILRQDILLKVAHAGAQGWPIAAAYVAGFLVMLAALGWHPDAPR